MQNKYKISNNLRWYLKIVGQHQPVLFLTITATALFKAAQLFLTALLPSLIVQALTEHLPLEQTLIRVFAVGIGLNICGVIATMINKWAQMRMMAVRMDLLVDATAVAVRVPYEKELSQGFRNRYGKGMRNAFFMGSRSGFEDYIKRLNDFVVNFVSLLIFVISLSTFNPWLLVLVLIVAVVSYFNFHKVSEYNEQLKEDLTGPDQEQRYLQRNAYNIDSAKEMRLYKLNDWFESVFDKNIHEQNRLNSNFYTWSFFADGFYAVLNFIQNSISYLLILAGTIAGTLTLTQFTLYFGFINQFSGLMHQIIESLILIERADSNTQDYRVFDEEVEASVAEANMSNAPLAESPQMEITFDHVTYSYPESATPSIEDVSFTLKSGEKLALVGSNGAGKSTIVMLMSGLLRPTSGKILLNGVDVLTLSLAEYQAKIAPVFQDAFVLALTLGQNISMTETYDTTRAQKALDESFLAEKVATLDKGLETPMTRYFGEDGVNLSGGEEQKLMLARALYKDAPLLILDEPTAALDALAEQQMYESYNKLTLHKTSVFVSHRLASTRFCDRILFMENGKLLEVGSHAELMKQSGKYAEMYNVQSYYYQKEVADV